MLSSRKQDALEAAAAEIGTAGGQTAVFAANAGEPDQIAACVAATVERFGRIDILVNNAATNPYMGRAIDIDLPRFDKTWQVNYRGPVVWIQEAWRASMARARRLGHQHLARSAACRSRRRIGHYNVTKAALLHLTRTLAADLAPGVRVNAICPGLVKTDMARALWEPAEEAIAKRMPLRRLGEPAGHRQRRAVPVQRPGVVDHRPDDRRRRRRPAGGVLWPC